MGIRMARRVDATRSGAAVTGALFTSQPGDWYPQDEHSSDRRPFSKCTSESWPCRPQMNCRTCPPTRASHPRVVAIPVPLLLCPLPVPSRRQTPAAVFSAAPAASPRHFKSSAIRLGSRDRASAGGSSAPVGTCRPRGAAHRGRLVKRAEDVKSFSVRSGKRNATGYRSRRMPRTTNATLAGRSPSRRMKYGNHCRPNGT